jgi:hypothetical protein
MQRKFAIFDYFADVINVSHSGARLHSIDGDA